MFGHTYQYQMLGEDVFIRKCNNCGHSEPVAACTMRGHDWRDTGDAYQQTRTGYDGKWVTRTKIQQCATCKITREVNC